MFDLGKRELGDHKIREKRITFAKQWDEKRLVNHGDGPDNKKFYVFFSRIFFSFYL